jgi:RimJ/RimL family protein N-acetyltransferase
MTSGKSALSSLTLRPATLADWRILLEWRNDPQTRRWSRQTAVIDEAHHRAWLAGVLADRQRRLLIAESAGQPVGTVRLDSVDHATEVSWTVAPELRGQGVGRRLVVQALQGVSGYVCARMHKDNVASVKIAQATGMQFETSEQDWLKYSRVRESRQTPEESKP